MKCPHCQADNREGRRFCSGCGKALPAACANCGFGNEPEARFCGGCGAALASGAAAQAGSATSGDRRPVSVMYADLSGYTALSAALDPEDTHRLLRRFFETVDDIVLGFGGTIDKHMGDSVMALFGAPVAHGNDPERAVRAALDIQAAMAGLSAEFGRPLQVHLGIALGEVVASGLGSAAYSAYTVTGEAANLAARLMERAAPGETLVAKSLYQATENVAAFAELGMEPLKGVTQPEPLYRLSGLRTDRPVERPMIGRHVELAQLFAMLDACRQSRRGGAVAIRGEPGIGKSRLIHELSAGARARRYRCVSGTELDFGAHKGEDALAAVTAGLLGSAFAASETARLQAIDQACVAGRDRPFVHDLLGLAQPPESEPIYAAMNAEARQRGKAAALVNLLRAASHDTPCLIAVEDVHWASATTLQLLAQLAATATGCAAVVVMTTRFDGDPFDATWRAQSAGGLSVMIDLRPLPPEDAADLATSIIAELDEFAHECVARAEGNPLFLEQLLRSRVAGGGEKLPHSLQGVVLARLDSLAPAERQALQAASVLGQRFVAEDLQALLGLANFDCQPMIQRHLLRAEGEGYLFAHALIRDGVYASLTRDRKRALHIKAAAHFTGRDPALQAEHLDRAEDPSAARAYLRAAEAEAAVYRLDRANSLVTRGLELAVGEDDLVRLGVAAGRLRLDAGLAKSARAAYATASSAAKVQIDRCRGLIGLAAADRVLADLDQALESLSAAETIAAAADSPALLSEIHYMRGNLHFARGQGEDCLREHHLALAAAKRADLPEWKARARSGLGDAAYLQGRVATARRHFQRCVELAERHGLLRIIPANQCMIGDCMSFELDFDGGLRQIAAARAAAIRIGDRFAEMFAGESESYVLLSAGRIREAEGPTETALDLAAKLGARRYEAFLRMVLASVRLGQNRAHEARQLLDTAMLVAEATGLGFCGPLICGAQALARGSGADGRAWIDRGEALLQHAGLVHNHVFFRKAAMEWAISAGDWPMVERMAQALVAYTAAEPLPYVDFMVSHVRALAALARNPQDLQAAATMERLAATARAVDLRLY